VKKLAVIVSLLVAVAFAQDHEPKTIKAKDEHTIAIAKLQNRQVQQERQLHALETQAVVLQDHISSLSIEINAAVTKAAKEKDVDLCLYLFDLKELVFVERVTEEQKKQAHDAGLCKEKKAEAKK
jgi:hypothetical protein